MLRISTLLLVLVAVNLVACGSPPAPDGAQDGAQDGSSTAPSAPLVVDVLRLVPRAAAERLSTTGTLRANEQVELVAEISGKLEEVLFREGTPVAKDSVLVQIDRRRVAAERERAVHRLRLAELIERRQQELLHDGLTSQSDYDSALSEANVLRAELLLAEAQLEKSEVRAPFSGTIGLRSVSPGAFLSAGDIIATLQDLDPIKLDFALPEAYSEAVKMGDVVSFRVRGVEAEQTAQIYAIEPAVDQATRSVFYRARTNNPSGRLVPGAFADVEVAVRAVPAALLVPNVAVIPELGGKKVFVVRDGKAVPLAIETGIRLPDVIEVTSGLKAGDVVIVSAIERLRSGLEVEAREGNDS
ncbi:MAG: efflux RND transporter periplasmic adaptor subunit [Thermoanaerobaculia bacterium]|nr:efflux RND transporter periplasmic adaptor subunit [Thermoanaerobaculia bacterium]